MSLRKGCRLTNFFCISIIIKPRTKEDGIVGSFVFTVICYLKPLSSCVGSFIIKIPLHFVPMKYEIIIKSRFKENLTEDGSPVLKTLKLCESTDTHNL